MTESADTKQAFVDLITPEPSRSSSPTNVDHDSYAAKNEYSNTTSNASDRSGFNASVCMKMTTSEFLYFTKDGVTILTAMNERYFVPEELIRKDAPHWLHFVVQDNTFDWINSLCITCNFDTKTILVIPYQFYEFGVCDPWTEFNLTDSRFKSEVKDHLTSSASSAPSSSSSICQEVDDEDENEYDGITMDASGMDEFPHIAEHCRKKPRGTPDKNRKICSNCYCYVCDKPASQCTIWNDHCMANSKTPFWIDARKNAKDNQNSSNNNSKVTTWTFKDLEQVFPHEAYPDGMSLKYHQAQSVAQMIYVEMNNLYAVSTQTKCDSLNDDISDRGRKNPIKFRTNCGGWLCDEVGMGKTCSIIALVKLSKDAKSKSSTYNIKYKYTGNNDMIFQTGLTIVMVTNNLTSQWVSEVHKLCPSLNILEWSPADCSAFSRRKREQEWRNIDKYDILVTTPGVFNNMYDLWKLMKFERLVIDEAHRLEDNNKRKVMKRLQNNVNYIWLVTATPTTNSNHVFDKNSYTDRASRIRGYPMKNQQEILRIVDDSYEMCRQLIIVHRKSQIIGNSQLLTIPPTAVVHNTVQISKDDIIKIKCIRCAQYGNLDSDQPESSLLVGNVTINVACEDQYYINVDSEPHTTYPFAPLETLHLCLTDGIINEKLKLMRQNIITGDNSPPRTIVMVSNPLKMDADHKNYFKYSSSMDSSFSPQVVYEYMVSKIMEMFKSSNYKIIQVFDNKKSNSLKRRRALDDFQYGHHDGPVVLISDTNISAEGLNLHVASSMHILFPLIRKDLLDQLKGRLNRHGQTKASYLHLYYASGSDNDFKTIDDLVYEYTSTTPDEYYTNFGVKQSIQRLTVHNCKESEKESDLRWAFKSELFNRTYKAPQGQKFLIVSRCNDCSKLCREFKPFATLRQEQLTPFFLFLPAPLILMLSEYEFPWNNPCQVESGQTKRALELICKYTSEVKMTWMIADAFDKNYAKTKDLRIMERFKSIDLDNQINRKRLYMIDCVNRSFQFNTEEFAINMSKSSREHSLSDILKLLRGLAHLYLMLINQIFTPEENEKFKQLCHNIRITLRDIESYYRQIKFDNVRIIIGIK